MMFRGVFEKLIRVEPTAGDETCLNATVSQYRISPYHYVYSNHNKKNIQLPLKGE